MWLFRIILGIFYIWSGYWLTYNVSTGEQDAAVITFMWIVGVTKIIFCMKEQFPSIAFMRPVLIFVLSYFMCPDIFSVFFTLAFIVLAAQIIIFIDGISILFTGKTRASYLASK